MANIQKQFELFHDVIRADYEHNVELCEKRDIIVERVQEYLREKKLPGCTQLMQGSYAMKTGVKVEPYPKLEPDIDVGLRFDFKETDHSAKTVRGWLLEAVKDHTNTVIDKGPCLRVVYSAGYHVDLVGYSNWTDDVGGVQYRLAHNTDGWITADPPALLEHVKRRRDPFKDTKDSATKTDQFRRTVRYLKRWNDEAIQADRSDKPTGLAFTILCCDTLVKSVSWDGTANDLAALQSLARTAATRIGRIIAKKPTPQYEDVLGRLTDKEMEVLKARFASLANALVAAEVEPDPIVACEGLQRVFGTEFPVPKRENTAKSGSGPAIISSTSAA